MFTKKEVNDFMLSTDKVLISRTANGGNRAKRRNTLSSKGIYNAEKAGKLLIVNGISAYYLTVQKVKCKDGSIKKIMHTIDKTK